MQDVPIIFSVILFWTIIYLVDFILKKYRKLSQTYIHLLKENGVSFSFGHIRWYTTKLNRCFYRWGKYYPNFNILWFTVGACFGVVAMVMSTIVLSGMLINALHQTSPKQLLIPVMPGINLPLSHIIYYFSTLFMAGIVHEIGHALAAVREQVRVNGFGIFFMVLYPGAFVDLFTEHLMVITPMRQLRIYCAGIWHNFILALFFYGFLQMLPWLLSLGYVTGRGAVILQSIKGSAVEESLSVGDYITSVHKCHVTRAEDWHSCLKQIILKKQHGYCTDMLTMTRKNSFLDKENYESKKMEDCCGNLTASRFCFSYHSSLGQHGYSCLPVRTMMSDNICSHPSECPDAGGDKVCIHPLLDNSSRLIKISHHKGQDVLFVGDPKLLFLSVYTGDYLPVWKYFPLKLPMVLETFSMYMISLSGALALLNATPCYWLDGQWILYAFVDFSLSKYLPDIRTRNALCGIILAIGTFLLATNIMIAVYALGKVT